MAEFEAIANVSAGDLRNFIFAIAMTLAIFHFGITSLNAYSEWNSGALSSVKAVAACLMEALMLVLVGIWNYV